MEVNELEQLFVDDLDILSDCDSEDNQEYMISSIEKMEILIKSSKYGSNFADAVEEWDELLMSSNFQSDRLFEVQTALHDTKTTTLINPNQKSVLNGNERTNPTMLTTKTAFSDIVPEKIVLVINTSLENEQIRTEIQELLDVMIESMESSESLYQSELLDIKSAQMAIQHETTNPPINNSPCDFSNTWGFNTSTSISAKDTQPPILIDDLEETERNIIIPVRRNTVEFEEVSVWNVDHILSVEENRKINVESDFEDAQRQIEKENEEYQQQLRQESRRREGRRRRREEEALKRKQNQSAEQKKLAEEAEAERKRILIEQEQRQQQEQELQRIKEAEEAAALERERQRLEAELQAKKKKKKEEEEEEERLRQEIELEAQRKQLLQQEEEKKQWLAAAKAKAEEEEEVLKQKAEKETKEKGSLRSNQHQQQEPQELSSRNITTSSYPNILSQNTLESSNSIGGRSGTLTNQEVDNDINPDVKDGDGDGATGTADMATDKRKKQPRKSPSDDKNLTGNAVNRGNSSQRRNSSSKRDNNSVTSSSTSTSKNIKEMTGDQTIKTGNAKQSNSKNKGNEPNSANEVNINSDSSSSSSRDVANSSTINRLNNNRHNNSTDGDSEQRNRGDQGIVTPNEQVVVSEECIVAGGDSDDNYYNDDLFFGPLITTNNTNAATNTVTVAVGELKEDLLSVSTVTPSTTTKSNEKKATRSNATSGNMVPADPDNLRPSCPPPLTQSVLEDYWRKLLAQTRTAERAAPRVLLAGKQLAEQLVSSTHVKVTNSCDIVNISSSDSNTTSSNVLLDSLDCWKYWLQTLPKNAPAPNTPTTSVPASSNQLSASNTTALRSSANNSSHHPPLSQIIKEENKLTLNVENIRSIDSILKDCDSTGSLSHIQYLSLNVNKLKHLSNIESLTSLVELHLKDNQIKNIDNIQHLTNLQILNLDSNLLTDLSPASKLPSLVTLTANSNRILQVPQLQQAVQLQRLELYQNQITAISKSQFQSLSSLTHLDLGRNKIAYIDGTILSQYCQFLTSLILSQNELVVVPYPLYLPFLRTLWLSGNKLCNLNEWSYHTASSSTGNTARNNSSNSNSSIRHNTSGSSSNSIHHHSPITLFLPLLEKLYLQDNTIINIATSTFQYLPSLTEIDLSFNQLANASSITGILETKKLKKLSLNDNTVNNDLNLKKWLLPYCPLLSELSGNNTSQNSNSTSSNRESDNNNNNNNNVTIKRSEIQNIYKNFQTSQKWKPSNFTRNTNIFSATYLDDVTATNATELQFDVSLYPNIPSNVMTSFDVSLLHLLLQISKEQNSHRLRSKYSKSNDKNDNSKDDKNNLKNKKVKMESNMSGCEHSNQLKVLDVPFLDLLQKHLTILLNYCCTTTSSDTTMASGSSDIIHVMHFSSSSSSSSPASFGSISSNNPKLEHSILKLQSYFRGVHVRKKLKVALASSKYIDDELDQLLEGSQSDLLDFQMLSNDLQQFNDLPIELSDNWLSVRTGGVATGAGVGGAMVYGDHRRSRKTSSDATTASGSKYSSNADHPCHNAYQDQDEEEEPPTPRTSNRNTSNTLQYSPSLILHPPVDRSYYQHSNSSTSNTTTGNTTSGSSGNTYPHTHRIHRESSFNNNNNSSMVPPLRLHTPNSESEMEYGQDGAQNHYYGYETPSQSQYTPSNAPTASSTGRSTPLTTTSRANSDPGTTTSNTLRRNQRAAHAKEESKLAEEWGIADPTVIAAMMKRNKRMKEFSDAKEKRELEKDPDIRLQRFRAASGVPVMPYGNTTGSTSQRATQGRIQVSGSFGGKPKSYRGGGKGGGGRGMGRGAVMPAWMNNNEDEQL